MPLAESTGSGRMEVPLDKNEKKSIQISEAEWQVMKVLWETPGLTAAQVAARISKEYRWSDGTIRTYLRRLMEKGALKFEQDKADSRIYYYFPSIDQESALDQESKSFLRRIIKGKAGIVLASLIEETELTENEITELEKILRQRRRSNE